MSMMPDDMKTLDAIAHRLVIEDIFVTKPDIALEILKTTVGELEMMHAVSDDEPQLAVEHLPRLIHRLQASIDWLELKNVKMAVTK